MLRLGTSDLEAREAELTGYLRELTEREKMLAQEEEELGRRRQELGAVELKRAALEGRERAVETREAELAERAAAAPSAAPAGLEPIELAFVPGGRYMLVELEAVSLAPGIELDVADETFVVARVGRSPLPGDSRRCAYLVRGVRVREPSSPGSS